MFYLYWHVKNSESLMFFHFPGVSMEFPCKNKVISFPVWYIPFHDWNIDFYLVVKSRFTTWILLELQLGSTRIHDGDPPGTIRIHHWDPSGSTKIHHHGNPPGSTI